MNANYNCEGASEQRYILVYSNEKSDSHVEEKVQKLIDEGHLNGALPMAKPQVSIRARFNMWGRQVNLFRILSTV